MSQLANPQNERQKGTLPSQPIMNPRNSQQAHLTKDQSLNQCNVVPTLRSEKKIDNQLSTPSNPIQQTTLKHPPHLVPILSNLTRISQPTSL